MKKALLIFTITIITLLMTGCTLSNALGSSSNSTSQYPNVEGKWLIKLQTGDKEFDAAITGLSQLTIFKPVQSLTSMPVTLLAPDSNGNIQGYTEILGKREPVTGTITLDGRIVLKYGIPLYQVDVINIGLDTKPSLKLVAELTGDLTNGGTTMSGFGKGKTTIDTGTGVLDTASKNLLYMNYPQLKSVERELANMSWSASKTSGI